MNLDSFQETLPILVLYSDTKDYWEGYGYSIAKDPKSGKHIIVSPGDYTGESKDTLEEMMGYAFVAKHILEVGENGLMHIETQYNPKNDNVLYLFFYKVLHDIKIPIKFFPSTKMDMEVRDSFFFLDIEGKEKDDFRAAILSRTSSITNKDTLYEAYVAAAKELDLEIVADGWMIELVVSKKKSKKLEKEEGK